MSTLPLNEKGRAALTGILADLKAIGDRIGAFDYEGMNWRPTGTTVRLTFDRGSHEDVATFLDYLMQCPALLASCCERLLEADDEYMRDATAKATA